ncbi:1017_t:CDS:2, partial [Acaulospora morrowiae]
SNNTLPTQKDRGDGNGGNRDNNNSTSPNPQDLRTTESIVCMIMLSSQTKEFPCEECTGYPNVFYNVSTFCVLKGIWANAINKTSFEQDLGWMNNSRFCEWGGVTCDSDKNIISLNLKNPNIPSTLSNDMGNLVTLQNLSISGNGALPKDKIPTKIFQLKNLISLSIVSTGLTGGIPDTINNMPLKFL